MRPAEFQVSEKTQRRTLSSLEGLYTTVSNTQTIIANFFLLEIIRHIYQVLARKFIQAITVNNKICNYQTFGAGPAFIINKRFPLQWRKHIGPSVVYTRLYACRPALRIYRHWSSVSIYSYIFLFLFF